ncbi:MAG TPA: hypothetical protein VGF85_08900 [Opitutaceae bacterium]
MAKPAIPAAKSNVAQPAADDLRRPAWPIYDAWKPWVGGMRTAWCDVSRMVGINGFLMKR